MLGQVGRDLPGDYSSLVTLAILEGALLLTPQEVAEQEQQADQQQRAERLAEQLRSLGVDLISLSGGVSQKG